ncbi:hypothetical protein LUZ60_006969 [Juncus effusus]|nr:hypothetical protein LUZ60_006969 [Juncus effusus]
MAAFTLHYILHPLPHKPLLQKPRHCSSSLHLHRASVSASSSSSSSSGELVGIEEGIPAEDVKVLAKFKSLHNHISVLQVSRRADHPFAGSRLLLLDKPGNIHSISFLFNPLTSSYLDIFASLPPILPSGPIALLGFGAGSAARIIFHFYPQTIIHGYELDPSVISVGREFFGLTKLESQYKDQLFVHVCDAIEAVNSMEDGFFSGILVDLFMKGTVIPQLQDKNTWKEMKRKLLRGGRIMVNCGGRCVEPEDPRRDGDVVKEKTLEAISEVFGRDKVFVLNLGGTKVEDNCVGLTGNLPDLEVWKEKLTSPLWPYVDMWKPYVRNHD